MNIGQQADVGLEAGLSVALEHIAAPAFLLRDDRDVRVANPAARQMLQEDEVGTLEQLRSIITGASRAGTVRIVGAEPLGPWFLIVMEDGAAAELVRRVSALARLRGLTPAQTRVLMSLAQGLTNRGIAADLRCSRRTVESHVVAIFDKLGVSSRAGVLATLLGA